MVFDVNTALTWILFLAMFPMAFFWLRSAWRIGVRRDYSEVALKRGESPPYPARFAPFALIINLVAGSILVIAIAGIVLGELRYESWSAIAGSTIWCKVFANFILSRHAHAAPARKKA